MFAYNYPNFRHIARVNISRGRVFQISFALNVVFPSTRYSGASFTLICPSVIALCKRKWNLIFHSVSVAPRALKQNIPTEILNGPLQGRKCGTFTSGYSQYSIHSARLPCLHFSFACCRRPLFTGWMLKKGFCMWIDNAFYLFFIKDKSSCRS